MTEQQIYRREVLPQRAARRAAAPESIEHSPLPVVTAAATAALLVAVVAWFAPMPREAVLPARLIPCVAERCAEVRASVPTHLREQRVLGGRIYLVVPGAPPLLVESGGYRGGDLVGTVPRIPFSGTTARAALSLPLTSRPLARHRHPRRR